MTSKLSLSDLPLRGKKVLMRVDFNVPLDAQGQIVDDTRIQASLPSIRYVLNEGGALILMSHLGRPKGQKNATFSLAACARRLSELLDKPVTLAPDCVGEAAEKMAASLKPGEVLLLENLRFHCTEERPEEEPNFAKQLARLGDCYVNDAFGTAHRAHASTVALPHLFPHASAAGFLMDKEIRFLGELLQNPKRPFYAIVGGSKISSKLGVLKSLIKKVDVLLIGGGMAYTFLKAQGIEIGNSIHEDDCLEAARMLVSDCQKTGVKLSLPEDIVVADALNDQAQVRIVDSQQGIPVGFEGVDIGPKTIQSFTQALREAATVLWNGPLGVFECPRFAVGTQSVARALAQLKAVTVVGGGDSIAALQKAEVLDKITHVSTGGGASLEYLEFGRLPGIEALTSVPNETKVRL